MHCVQNYGIISSSSGGRWRVMAYGCCVCTWSVCWFFFRAQVHCVHERWAYWICESHSFHFTSRSIFSFIPNHHHLHPAHRLTWHTQDLPIKMQVFVVWNASDSRRNGILCKWHHRQQQRWILIYTFFLLSKTNTATTEVVKTTQCVYTPGQHMREKFYLLTTSPVDSFTQHGI